MVDLYTPDIYPSKTYRNYVLLVTTPMLLLLVLFRFGTSLKEYWQSRR